MHEWRVGVQVLYWGTHEVARELEDPFLIWSTTYNCLPFSSMQWSFNEDILAFAYSVVRLPDISNKTPILCSIMKVNILSRDTLTVSPRGLFARIRQLLSHWVDLFCFGLGHPADDFLQVCAYGILWYGLVSSNCGAEAT